MKISTNATENGVKVFGNVMSFFPSYNKKANYNSCNDRRNNTFKHIKVANI